MNRSIRTALTLMVVLAMCAASVPAVAADDHGRASSGRAVAQSAPRQAPSRSVAAPAPRAMTAPSRPAPSVVPQASRSYAAPRAAVAAPPAAVARGAVAPSAVAVPRGTVAAVAPRAVAVPRAGVVQGYAVPRPAYGPVYGPPVAVVRPYYYYPYGYYPYYTFHSHFALSFGFYVGYPFAYPGWYNPYAVGTFGYGVPYGAAYGGLSFNIQPYDAAVFIDGIFVGSAADFGPQAAPLTLRAGLHHVELRANGFAPIAFDITVVPGQVIPYQGSLPVVQ
jgi:hypothetical protein